MAWDQITGQNLDPNDKWWKITRDLMTAIGDAGRGKWLTGLPDLNGPLNILASLRCTQTLLTDLLDCPEEVKSATRHINKIWHACAQELFAISGGRQPGNTNWMGVWFPGKGTDVQCDFAAMLSPAMFEEFVLPDVQESCRNLEYSLFHLDGPQQIAHLDMLLEIPQLNGIEWVPGDGNEHRGSPKWFPLYRRIQAKKKLLVIRNVPKDSVERLMAEIRPQGVLMEVVGCTCEAEARHFLKMAEQWR
jgi:5-methyltetrahydrofolate--homocysteine methyltransferase